MTKPSRWSLSSKRRVPTERIDPTPGCEPRSVTEGSVWLWRKTERAVLCRRTAPARHNAAHSSLWLLASHAHESRPQPQPLLELRRNVRPVVNEQVHKLPAVDQIDPGEGVLKRYLSSGGLAVGRRDEGEAHWVRWRLSTHLMRRECGIRLKCDQELMDRAVSLLEECGKDVSQEMPRPRFLTSAMSSPRLLLLANGVAPSWL